MLIGEVATRSEVPARTIRFYEQVKVLTPPARASSGYRVYSERTLSELRFIKRAQRLGFSLDEIRQILAFARDGRVPCNRVVALCDAHLDQIERQMAELRAFRKLLQDARRKAKAQCGSTREGFCKAIMGERR